MSKYTKAELDEAYEEIAADTRYREKQRREEALVDEVVGLLSGFIPNRTNAPQALWRALEATAAEVIELVREHDADDG